MINDTITLNNTASLFGSYLTTPLADIGQLYTPVDINKAFVSLDNIQTALDSTMPTCELLIVAIGQTYTEKFKLKYTVSQAYLTASTFSGEEVIDKLCQEKVKEMRLELVRHAYYDTFNISIYLNDNIICSMITDNADIDSEIRRIYG